MISFQPRMEWNMSTQKVCRGNKYYNRDICINLRYQHFESINQLYLFATNINEGVNISFLKLNLQINLDIRKYK